MLQGWMHLIAGEWWNPILDNGVGLMFTQEFPSQFLLVSNLFLSHAAGAALVSWIM
jgi:hypothetical protein